MKRFQSFLGRRQFLMGSMASASALALKNMVAGRGTALAADVPEAKMPVSGKAAGTPAAYPHFLSPLKVRNKVLKNRIMLTPSPPHSLQGPENYPADPFRAHYSQMAKNAALVAIKENFGQYPRDYASMPDDGRAHYSDSTWEDIPPVHNYVQQMIEEIHCEGALVLGRGVAGGGTSGGRRGPGQNGYSAEEVITQAKKMEDKGYDAVWVGSRYVKNREELGPVIEQMQAVRKATNLIVVSWILPFTPGKSRGKMAAGVGADSGDLASGPEFEEVMAMVKMLEGSADIVQLKDTGHFTNHPNSFSMEQGAPWMLRFSEAIKERGVDIIVCPTGGFQDPVLNEEIIAGGKADMVGMATPLFADPEYVQKVSNGRGDDIVPCVKCHNCHGISRTRGPWYDTCTVNPKWGLSETKQRSIRPPSAVKKVAVVGGGPGGMKAAITAAERGHKVTLFEKADALGGLMRHTDYSKWKWTYRVYKDYLARQTAKAGVAVRLGTDATPGMIRSGGFDTVLVATGAAPMVPKIPGADSDHVFDIVGAYRNKAALGKKVVMIGAGVFGTETAICLAKDGHKVTVLASGKEMIPEEAIGPHNMEIQIDLYKHHQNISYELETLATGISKGRVAYRDAGGAQKTVKADSVVIYAGLRPKMDEALKFTGSAGQVLLLGDCTGKGGTLQKTIRSAYFVASQV
jgi:2,4-dienoyl-CoA reductase-like NADH-dependent reductase (Old Yellow Enzyme family)/thioredoxin reductase